MNYPIAFSFASTFKSGNNDEVMFSRFTLKSRIISGAANLSDVMKQGEEKANFVVAVVGGNGEMFEHERSNGSRCHYSSVSVMVHTPTAYSKYQQNFQREPHEQETNQSGGVIRRCGVRHVTGYGRSGNGAGICIRSGRLESPI